MSEQLHNLHPNTAVNVLQIHAYEIDYTVLPMHVKISIYSGCGVKYAEQSEARFLHTENWFRFYLLVVISYFLSTCIFFMGTIYTFRFIMALPSTTIMRRLYQNDKRLILCIQSKSLERHSIQWKKEDTSSVLGIVFCSKVYTVHVHMYTYLVIATSQNTRGTW